MAEEVKSTMKSIFDWRSKTFWGTVLAILSIVIDSVLQLEGLPKVVMSIVQVLLFLLAGFGLADAAKQQKEDLIKKVKEYIVSSPAIGILISVLAHLSEEIPQMNDMPSGAIWAAKSVGALLVAMGLRQLSAQARANFDNRNQEAVEKYRHLLS